jgi:hypothetical protein
MFVFGMLVGLALVVVGAVLGTLVQRRFDWPWK